MKTTSSPAVRGRGSWQRGISSCSPSHSQIPCTDPRTWPHADFSTECESFLPAKRNNFRPAEKSLELCCLLKSNFESRLLLSSAPCLTPSSPNLIIASFLWGKLLIVATPDPHPTPPSPGDGCQRGLQLHDVQPALAREPVGKSCSVQAASSCDLPGGKVTHPLR